ncbi:hypothetical protein OG21DRAFT_1174302 [Imleria badia]|nr:hypothetical protein OG21DRAFT_1174302 [Imleria badia]
MWMAALALVMPDRSSTVLIEYTANIVAISGGLPRIHSIPRDSPASPNSEISGQTWCTMEKRCSGDQISEPISEIHLFLLTKFYCHGRSRHQRVVSDIIDKSESDNVVVLGHDRGTQLGHVSSANHVTSLARLSYGIE